jgi:hypothetical protein
VSQSALAVATWLTIMLGALTAVGLAGRFLWRMFSRLQRLLDALLGEPPGPGAREGRPGILDRFESFEGAIQKILDTQRSLDERLTFVEQQMRPNGGSSLRDTVDRIAATTDSTPPEARSS